MIEFTYKVARRIAVAVIGGTLLVVGVFMLVIPGPAIVVIPIGLAILGAEFAWARRWLRKLRRTISRNAARNHAGRAQAHRDRL